MKDIYMLDYPNISLKLFDYEDMTIYFNENIWNLVIDFDEDEQCFFISNDEMNIYAVGFNIKELIEDLKERICGIVVLFYDTPDDNLAQDAIDLKKLIRESFSIRYKLERRLSHKGENK